MSPPTPSEVQAPEAVDVHGPSGVFITERHYFEHQGRSFNFSSSFTLLANSSIYLLGKSGDYDIHFYAFDIRFSAGGVTIELFEEPTISDEGIQQTTVNKNRKSTKSSAWQVFTEPTVDNEGSKLNEKVVFESGGSPNTSKDGADPREWILNSNTYYLYKFTNNTGSDISISSEFDWYEPEV